MGTPSLADRLAERTLELVRVPSAIGQEERLADAVEAWALRHFPREDVVRVSHSLVVGRRLDTRPTLALVGHLDTVPPSPSGNPPRREGDRLFGLGVSDMKGALAVMMALAEDLPRDALPVNLLLVFYEREEGPYEESGLGPLVDAVPQVRQAAFAVALEPTDLAVQVACVGSLHATLSFRGVSAHSARPWQGRNAIHAAGSLLVDLAARGRRDVTVKGFTYAEVMSATLAHGGRARNVVPDAFELNLNYRFAPGKTALEAEHELRAFVCGRCDVRVVDRAPAGRVCADNGYFRALVEASGRAAEAKQAWTDVARLAEWGVDAVNFGPGETAQAHQAGESASVAALVTAYQALAALLSSAAVSAE
jgi:succinyl-diaminopimelate desuccinylase